MSRGKWIALTLLGCLLIYPPIKLYWAERQVTTFCENVMVGAPIETLERAAKDSWLQIRKLPTMTVDGKPYPPRLLVWEGFAFGRWFCEISHAHGKVESKRVTELD